MLPFQIEDAAKRVENQEEEENYDEAAAKAKAGGAGEEQKTSYVGQDVRLNNRIIDLRVPAN
jgi:hypothetical protein